MKPSLKTGKSRREIIYTIPDGTVYSHRLKRRPKRASAQCGELQSGERRKAASIVSEFNWSKEKKHHGRAHMNPLIGGKSIG
jgi:hypothetical protein